MILRFSKTMSELTDYLAKSDQFKLGELETELQHPSSKNLSQLVQDDPYKAIDVCRNIDITALDWFKHNADELIPLAEKINKTLEAGNNIYLCGCGATGRLSLSLEVLCREGMIPEEYKDRVIGFMAGGDTALIRSIENFEDRKDYGERQLEELGFKEGDLLISTTEGGETSFVIGATEYAAEHSSNSPYFLYCNPDYQLEDIERSKKVIDNEKINKINLSVGPMTIAGSTRMQASTVLMAGVGMALMNYDSPDEIKHQVNNLINETKAFNFSFLKEFIEKEADVYKNGNKMLYKTDKYGIAVLTDTTERAPTFSYPPFENFNLDQPESLSYLMIEGAETADDAWNQLLHREPRCIEWDEHKSFAGRKNLSGYDISENVVNKRDSENIFEIMNKGDYMSFKLDDLEHEVSIKDKPLLFQHLLLKMALNTHSTLVMGKMGRYEGNLMTYVKPSNYKLIDRAIRYVQILHENNTGEKVGYDDVAELVFQEKENLDPDEPIVIKVLNALKGT